VRTADDSAVQLALAAGLVTAAQLAAAQARMQRWPGPVQARPGMLDWLAGEGTLDGRSLARVLAEKSGLPLVDLPQTGTTAAALAALPRGTAERMTVFPLARDTDSLRVAVANPFDFGAIDELGHLTGLGIEPTVAPLGEIRLAISRHYGADAIGAAADEAPARYGERDNDPPIAVDDEAPVIQLVQAILRDAINRRASDIHFEPLERRFRVRFRIDGVLQEIADPPWRLQRAVISRLKIMANMSIAENRLPQDGRARIGVEGRLLDLRLSSLPTVHGESIVMRILEPERLRLGLEKLGLDPGDRQSLERLLAWPDGIVLVTGPTGSGKTTTLYACLHQLNRADRKIITVEDPVEYQITGINQVSVRGETGLTFATALRAMLRQAPNIIMVGEIRDRETAGIAINAALTGHLVLSTLHTNDAAGAVTRLIDIGVKPFLVASGLRAVVAQRLVRRVCPECGQPAGLTAIERRGWPASLAVAGASVLRRGAGCLACERAGYRGRVGLFEFLHVDDRIRRLIHEGGSAARLRAEARAAGMATLREDGWRKVRAGLTTIDEVLASTVDDANGL
jgi:general secretion pathway protein E/type IV pilus assembly protein PilB